MFTRAIVKRPTKSMVKGITEATLGKPKYKLALEQHDDYIQALIDCGLEVTVLGAEEKYPDSVFIEDTALLTPHCAIITNPGSDSRKGEIKLTEDAVRDFYENIEYITSPNTLDAGDIMMVGSHFYIGLSDRTTQAGADQLIAILEKYGMTGSVVSLEKVLHLKTGVVYLENNTLFASGEFIDKPEFAKFNIIKVDEDESYSANCIWINDKVLIAKGYPKTKKKIEDAGYETIELDMSEFRKLDGGLSCLSLRF